MMLFSLYIVTRVDEKRLARREDIERHAVSRVPTHSAYCEDNRYAVPMGSG